MAASFRRNVMGIESIDSFINLKGGYRAGVRDVYFVRALGEPANLKGVVASMDARLSEAAEQNRLYFKRVSRLKQLSDRNDADYYAAQYDGFSAGKAPCLKSAMNPAATEALSRALKETIKVFSASRPGVTDTIIKNFAVKLLFWTDDVLGSRLKDWTEAANTKLIAANVTAQQEYLFWYMLTGLGCDVLLLNTAADVNADKAALSLSQTFRLGGFGNTPVPEYTAPQKPVPAPTPVEARPRMKIESNPARQPAVNIPPRTPQPVAPRVQMTVNAAPPVAPKVQMRQEMSYEQLAKLASSIVMITIIDAGGKPVGTGSGIYINSRGYILTNNHVVSAGRAFAIRIEDDEKLYLTNQIVKYNPQLDLAVLKIERENRALTVYDGREQLVRGQKVVAIGSPMGLFNTVSDGIISGFRNISDRKMIQFTAPTSHGSSGGALLNMFGEIIGISTGGIDDAQNISLAVGYEDIRMFAGGLLETTH